MASIWKDSRSPYWVACFTAFVGLSAQQLKRTTATTDKKLARRIADELDDCGRGVQTPESITAFLEAQKDLRVKRAAKKAFDYVLRRTTGRGLAANTVRGFVESWLGRTRGEIASASWTRYEGVMRHFLASLGGKADQDMNEIKQADIARFRDSEARRVSAASANIALKIVRIIFKAAEADGAVTRNEARHVKKLKTRSGGSARRAFSLPELKAILGECDDEWRSLVLFGFYTGARLGDIALLTWQNLDLTHGEVRYTQRKTGRTVVLPMAKPLVEQLERMPAGEDPKQPVHSRAFEIATREGRVGTLSRQFNDIMAAAGLVKPRTHEAGGKKNGRAACRETSEISFHALRHTAVSLLKSAGVSDAVARDLVGHESAEVSRLYTHIEDKAKREAVDKLPALE